MYDIPFQLFYIEVNLKIFQSISDSLYRICMNLPSSTYIRTGSIPTQRHRSIIKKHICSLNNPGAEQPFFIYNLVTGKDLPRLGQIKYTF